MGRAAHQPAAAGRVMHAKGVQGIACRGACMEEQQPTSRGSGLGQRVARGLSRQAVRDAGARAARGHKRRHVLDDVAVAQQAPALCVCVCAHADSTNRLRAEARACSMLHATGYCGAGAMHAR